MNIKKIIVAIIVMYILHLIVANWAPIKQIITGTYEKGFVFYDLKLLIICALVVFLVLMAPFTYLRKK